eukprot:TRINITY_DN76357_c0_g1_i1.p1 TRINITY_DN76357_c0_g1~~TRINITY_DN76357_c0_g1_i1.p1  ORF type:complete len:5100 (-),score=780.62 TRINITY_DN76357_c0_g1_i1:121-13482(-)
MAWVALYGAHNPEYRAQTPIFEGTRSDILRGPFGFGHNVERGYNAEHVKVYSPSIPYTSLKEAANWTGLVTEVLGFFLPPFTATYSFMVWGWDSHDLWISTSSSMEDAVLAAESIAGQPCRHGDSTRLGCSVFDEGYNWGKRAYGRLANSSLGFKAIASEIRTPTVQSISMVRGQRYQFVRRQFYPDHADNHRRRRQYFEGTGVRIHKPDLSQVTPSVREKLKESTSWPEVVRITTRWQGQASSTSGTWSFGVFDGNTTVWSVPLKWAQNGGDRRGEEWRIQSAWDSLWLTSGKTSLAEVWPVKSSDSHVTYIMIVWKPAGNLPDLQVDTSLLVGGGTVEIETFSDGDAEDLLMYPVPGDFLEAPAVSPQAKLSVNGIPARHAEPISAVAGNAGAYDGLTYSPFDYTGFMFSSDEVSALTCDTPQQRFRYLKFTTLQIYQSGRGKTCLAEIQLWSSGAEPQPLIAAAVTAIPSEWSDTSLAGLVDGDMSTFACANNETVEVQLDLGSGNEIALEMWGFGTSTQRNWYDPVRWLLQGSVDGAVWVNISDQSEEFSHYDLAGRSQLQGPYPSEIGQTACSSTDESGCGWGPTFAGNFTHGDGQLDEALPYPSWRDCQRRCCADQRCRAASFDSSSGLCVKFSRPLEAAFGYSATGKVSNLVLRGEASDGYAVTKQAVDLEGIPLDEFTGHQSVKLCKERCNAHSSCHSFSWHESEGCFLKSKCVTNTTRLTSARLQSASFVTYYQTRPADCSTTGGDADAIGSDFVNATLASATSSDVCSSKVFHGLRDDSGSDLGSQDLDSENGTSLAGQCCSLCKANPKCGFWQVNTEGQPPRCNLRGTNVRTLRARKTSLAGFARPLEESTTVDQPDTLLSSLASHFFPETSSAITVATDFSFQYLSAAETPFVSEVAVNGVSASPGSVAMAEGNILALKGGNFDGVNTSDVQIFLGMVKGNVSDLNDTHITIVLPAAPHETTAMQLLLGWKGLADFAAFTGSADPSAQVEVAFGGGVCSMDSLVPSSGSVKGGLSISISGKGFSLPASSNQVQILDGGSTVVGTCNVTAATVDRIECILPELDLSGWTSGQTSQSVSLLANTASVSLPFNYTLESTPQVDAVSPASLSFAVTDKVTLSGSNFGINAAGDATVKFGKRPCRVLSGNDTNIVCRLLRSSMAQAPVCVDEADIFNPSCTVAPAEFVVQPEMHVKGKGSAKVNSLATVDMRFEVHEVSPVGGSELGGATVTISGIGFGSPEATTQRMVGMLGTFADVQSWSNTEIVVITRPVTLNTALVDVSVNLITAQHMCGGGKTAGPCTYAALNADLTPEITSVSSKIGSGGDELVFEVKLPQGYGSTINPNSVTVALGDHSCTLSQTSVSGDVATIKCIVPEFEASIVQVKLLVPSLGFASSAGTFTQELRITSISAESGSLGGREVVLQGSGFSTEAERHMVRVGQSGMKATCEPSVSTYSTLSCMMNWVLYDTDHDSNTQLYVKDVEVSLWDVPVWSRPLSAFGSSMVGCLGHNDDWYEGSVSSQEECALRCLLKDGCVSFDYRPRYMDCRMSKNSFTRCSDCWTHRWKDCRYYETRSEIDPKVVISAKASSYFNFTYNRSMTPDIQWMFTLPGAQREGLAIQTNDTGCSANNTDEMLKRGNDQCCSDHLCSWGEGRCGNSEQCAGNLECQWHACSWSHKEPVDQFADRCCILRGRGNYYNNLSRQIWSVGDEVVLRMNNLGVLDLANNHKADAAVAAAARDPSNGYVTVSFGGVACAVTEIRNRSYDSGYIDVACTLGEIPGGLVHSPQMTVTPLGRAREPEEWLWVPLKVDALNASTGALGGGWSLEVTGSGFAPPPAAGSDTFLEVSVCGKPCTVLSGSYTSAVCKTPAVLTPSLFDGSLPEFSTPSSRVLSAGAGGAREPGEISWPTCFVGSSADHYEPGHPGCVAAFDNDTELEAGTTGAGCHIGLDFGPHMQARVERIRYFPRFKPLDAEKYVSGQLQVGVLDESSACDELTWGWRGSDYVGCQDTATNGKKCARWDEQNPGIVAKSPELAGHAYCRNPDPAWRFGLWCYNSDGKVMGCTQKVPAILWTTVETINSDPKMLWNTVTLSQPQLARFVRFVGPAGECRFTELQVVGNLVTTGSTCPVAVRNVRRAPGQGNRIDVNRPAWREGGHAHGGFLDIDSDWVTSPQATVQYLASSAPVVHSITPNNGTARGGTEISINGENLGPQSAWQSSGSTTSPVSVTVNSYSCDVTFANSTLVTCMTGPRDSGIHPPSFEVMVEGVGLAIVHPDVRYRYLDRWSDERTWANREPPVDGDLVVIPDGQAVLLDMDTPLLDVLIVEGVLVWDDTQDLQMDAKYIWVKGGTFELGTESKPFLNKATITLHGEKYKAIRLPVIGAKALAVSNQQFTIRTNGDGADVEDADGKIGTLDIHGAPRQKVWTRLARTAEAGDTEIMLQDKVDFASGEELLVTATVTPPKEMHGEGLHGAPPVDFEDERVLVASLGQDQRTVYLSTPLKHRHISTSYTRPDGEYVDLSAEVALLSRNVKIQGDESSEKYSWGGHTMLAFGGIYRVENAEFFRMGQTGELSRYPIHFHVAQQWGSRCYAKHNSIHHSFQRAIAIHSTEYVLVKGNVAFDIVGHMYFIETGMERFNILEGNLGVGAIPLLSGMLESDQEPAAFWTAAPNNIWRDNVAVTGSDGWYFQLPDHPISHNLDVYKSSICPVGDRVGEWSGNRCHHTTGSCIRVYLTWKPTVDPCNGDSGESPQILFNTTCWGVGFICFNAMKAGSIHNHHMTSIETIGGPDVFVEKFNRGESFNGAFKSTDWMGIPHVKDSVFVGILPQNLDVTTSEKWKGCAIEMPQDEQFFVTDSVFENFRRVPILMDCSACWSRAKWRQGAFTYRIRNLTFVNSTKRIYVQKKGIYWDLDGSITGMAGSYTTWADKYNIDSTACTVEDALSNTLPNTSAELPGTMHSSGGLDSSASIFHVVQNENSVIHSRRDYAFITCSRPIRKMEIVFPEPMEVALRQLNVTNLGTGLTQVLEFEDKELFGWTFPALANTRLEIRPNLVGLDLTEASVRYGFSDLFKYLKDEAAKANKEVEPEWLQMVVASWSKWHHYNLVRPDWMMVATRYGLQAGEAALPSATKMEEVADSSLLAAPESLPNMAHGMITNESWAVNFRYPDATGYTGLESLAARFEAKRCPEEGCTAGLPELNQEWDNPIKWSVHFGTDTASKSLTINAQEWIVFDMPEKVLAKDITIFGKLSFDDAADRSLEVDHMVVWGLLEIGSAASPFGASTGSRATVALRGSATDTDTYVYIEEQTLHNKVIAVGGQLEAHGAGVTEPWVRLHQSVEAGATSACVLTSDTSASLDWPAGSEVALAPTEFDRPAEDVETVTLTGSPEKVGDCWKIEWSGGLKKARFAGDVDIGNGASTSLRTVAARVDRTVTITSASTDKNNYGGHIEIMDLADLTPRRVGRINLRHIRFHQLGKGGLSAAVYVGYQENFSPPPENTILGCSWTNSFNYGLHVDSTNSPLIITENVFIDSHNGGIFVASGSSSAMIVRNAVIGVSMSPQAPVMTNEFNTAEKRVINYAGIRTDELPVRMDGNVVAGSNDMGFLHRAEDCDSVKIFDNEAFATIVGVFVLSQKSGNCQAVQLYKVWKAAHIGVFLADIRVSTRLSSITVSDSHLGIVPYFSMKGFKRLWVFDAVIIGSSPASSCSASKFCRTQSASDPFMSGCNSIFAPVNFRRVGFVVPFNTKNAKTCDSVKSPDQCRLISPAWPELSCHFPLEYHNHFDKGLGWMFFERTTFAYWSASDCGRTSRAISMSVSGAEIQFPATFTGTTWHQADAGARFEFSAAKLNDAFVGRKTPCNLEGGGCMGLDQMLLQDEDGTLLNLPNVNSGSVVPLTPRTENVWSSQCTSQLEGVTIGALICPGVTVQLNEMHNLDRGAVDIKFGPWALTPDAAEDNGFAGGVLSSVGPFYGSCPCGWDFSFYHVLAKPSTTYYSEVVSFPENFKLRYWSPKPQDSVVLQYFYPDSAGVNVFVGSQKKVDLSLALARVPTLEDPHGSHTVDAQAKRLYVTLRGSTEGFNGLRDVVIRKTPTVKLKMNVQISLDEFNGDNFAMNLATLLGIPAERIKVVAVEMSRRLANITTPRRLAANPALALDVSILPSVGSSNETTSTNASSEISADDIDNQATELKSVASTLNALVATSNSGSSALAQAAGGEVVVTELEEPAEVDQTLVAEETLKEDAIVNISAVDVDVVSVAKAKAAVEVTELTGCAAGSKADVVVGSTAGQVAASVKLESGATSLVNCATVDPEYGGKILLRCKNKVLRADSTTCAIGQQISSTLSPESPETPTSSTGSADSGGCQAGAKVSVKISAGNLVDWKLTSKMPDGGETTEQCNKVGEDLEGTMTISCVAGLPKLDIKDCVQILPTSGTVEDTAVLPMPFAVVTLLPLLVRAV